MVILNILTIFSALIGGVGAVMIGQILSLYRDDIDSARHVRYQLNYLQLLTEKEFSIAELERASNKMKENIEDATRENMWLFSEEGKTVVLRLIHDLNRLEQAASDQDQERIDGVLDSISEKCDSMDDKIAYIDFEGALNRYFGSERPYSDYSGS